MDNNIIPIMTDPQGQYWEQPNLADILIDDKHAMMNQHTFNQLSEYSCTIPTAVYPGKMWKAYQHDIWYLRWFGESEDPKMCSNHVREIMLI